MDVWDVRVQEGEQVDVGGGVSDGGHGVQAGRGGVYERPEDGVAHLLQWVWQGERGGAKSGLVSGRTGGEAVGVESDGQDTYQGWRQQGKENASSIVTWEALLDSTCSFFLEDMG